MNAKDETDPSAVYHAVCLRTLNLFCSLEIIILILMNTEFNLKIEMTCLM